MIEVKREILVLLALALVADAEVAIEGDHLVLRLPLGQKPG